jgi:ribosomal protein S18 acetylase RimI-like enzyme
VWTREEDMLIVHFYFDQSARRQEMAQMLTRKSLDYLIERYRFINLSVGHTLQQALAGLASLQSV